MKLEIPDTVATQFFLSHIEGAQPSSGKYRGRCPVCGDSDRKKSKKRMYLLKNQEASWITYCHNCEYSSTLYCFIRDFFPEELGFIKSQCFSNMFLKEEKEEEKEIEFKRYVRKPKSKIKTFLDTCCIKLIPNENTKLNGVIKEQRKILLDRNLKEDLIDTFYYCYKNNKDEEWFYYGRVIIPFFDDKGEPYYFQAKATLEGQTPKYNNWKQNDIEQSKPEYNEYNIDKSKEVYIIEGLFDSTFVDNSVSTLGVKMSDEKISYLTNKYPRCVFCLDNDTTGLYWTEKLLKKRKKCLIFPKEYKTLKDLNEIVNSTGIENLTDFIRTNSYNSIQGLLKIKELENAKKVC